MLEIAGEVCGEVIAPNAEGVDHEGPRVVNDHVEYACLLYTSPPSAPRNMASRIMSAGPTAAICLRAASSPVRTQMCIRDSLTGMVGKAGVHGGAAGAHLGAQHVGKLEHQIEVLPVSYTHLDVYKRQPYTSGTAQVPQDLRGCNRIRYNAISLP